MADTRNGLPEGTDTIIEGGGAGGGAGGSGRSGTTGGSGSPSTATNSTGGRTSTTDNDAGTNSLITGSTSDQGRSLGTGTGSGGSTSSGGSGSTGGSTGSDSDTASSSGSGGIRGMLSNATTKARDEAGTRARGLVGQGLTSSSAALGNVASIIEDTVEQIGERLGPQYADYARTASQTVNRYATTLQDKDPDELVEDARDLVRKSPGIALAGAAIVGFGLVRLLKAGVEGGSDTAGSTSGRKNSQSA
jgi:hypothetical protein